MNEVVHPGVTSPTLVISPFRRYQAAPFQSLIRVTRRPTSSTRPSTSLIFTASPTPYWSSKMMKSPARTSLTSVCAPKARATPTIPAEVRIGVILMPMVLNPDSRATMIMMATPTFESSPPTVVVR